MREKSQACAAEVDVDRDPEEPESSKLGPEVPWESVVAVDVRRTRCYAVRGGSSSEKPKSKSCMINPS